MLSQEDDILFNGETEDKEKAFDYIYKKYHKLLWMEAAACLDNPSQSKDIVQEIFASLWEKGLLTDISPSARKAYLLQCVRHKCLRINKNEASLKTKISSYAKTKEAFSQEHDTFVYNEIKDKLALALGSLPEKAGRAFEMVYIEEMEQKKVAEELQISLQTLRNQIHSSLKKLREKLTGI